MTDSMNDKMDQLGTVAAYAFVTVATVIILLGGTWLAIWIFQRIMELL